jgi:predicted N-acetyltransferase YhbS
MEIKPASELDEFLQIHRLNYQTFVEEIPQHKQNAEKLLVDKFHNTNNYIVAKRQERVVGMVSYNANRPFSLDAKLDNLDRYLPACAKLVEVRLLAVATNERKTTIAYRLLTNLCKTLIAQNVDAAVISGTTRQLRLYSKIGFTPFALVTGSQKALYQPMFITLKNLRDDFKSC